MLSLLDMANHFLGYFNVNTTLKGRIYTILGFFGDWYLLYIGIRFIQNQGYLRGALLILVFFALMYFTLVNFFFYFLKRRFVLDPSEKIAALLGDERLKEQESRFNEHDRYDHFAPATGLYDEKQVIPAKVELNGTNHKNLAQIAAQLQAANLLPQDYEGHSDQEVLSQAKETNKPVFAIGEGTPLPYFDLRQQDGHFVVYAGMNQMTALPVGRVTRVGLSDIKQAHEQFKLFLATAVLQGGVAKSAGRSGVIERRLPYTVKVEVAFSEKNSASNATSQNSSAFSESQTSTEDPMRSFAKSAENLDSVNNSLSNKTPQNRRENR
ncbi:DUF6681 family protein [Furfurilactobacillus rossiae]|uniref:Uncharacterized protein n=1 Tax=Furfurilactobacillus rossiae DSM 15814 TaxID=1114972 RepID=A0A0R1R8G4_9LACO|nr:DUF6681 family protein [Furfurilactobacillus rossiae]KRL52750.1 hypothetical protein FD35_GL001841 [Furfurilactobacillus rossiae DSM 15814]QFR66684.1 hypothetical protein LR814_06060 [Furfurilactobacillus rossiae]QLE62160.1 hypothetical protein LROSRS0_2115 [Furfurilactobacillus rossiae]